jgi:hypothetical protein
LLAKFRRYGSALESTTNSTNSSPTEKKVHSKASTIMTSVSDESLTDQTASLSSSPSSSYKKKIVTWKQTVSVILIPERQEYYDKGIEKDVWDLPPPLPTTQTGLFRENQRRAKLNEEKIIITEIVRKAIQSGENIEDITFPPSMEKKHPRLHADTPFAHHLKDVIYTC